MCTKQSDEVSKKSLKFINCLQGKFKIDSRFSLFLLVYVCVRVFEHAYVHLYIRVTNF